ncbi:MAG: hypothetical protein AVDCRST_MAG93-3256 [uncultured Chloroflexia bacterium]|uniref:Uncharacterized protein n=1 Tax=uncultured Chloroflexia bacterium TaxID=1672391 RepID=A0A6J4JM01_9CHLR|nr:MAG: hypothetical protein AVDCRST_MAG93-3256 [uncultured Chloroflexia bacterium]
MNMPGRQIILSPQQFSWLCCNSVGRYNDQYGIGENIGDEMHSM